MLRNRWVRDDTRAIAKNVLLFVARVDVEALQVGAVRPWNDIPVLLRKLNRIVHMGDEATAQEATWAVDTAAALYGALLPSMRILCGLDADASYNSSGARCSCLIAA